MKLLVILPHHTQCRVTKLLPGGPGKPAGPVNPIGPGNPLGPNTPGGPGILGHKEASSGPGSPGSPEMCNSVN